VKGDGRVRQSLIRQANRPPKLCHSPFSNTSLALFSQKTVFKKKNFKKSPSKDIPQGVVELGGVLVRNKKMVPASSQIK